MLVFSLIVMGQNKPTRIDYSDSIQIQEPDTVYDYHLLVDVSDTLNIRFYYMEYITSGRGIEKENRIYIPFSLNILSATDNQYILDAKSELEQLKKLNK